MQRPAWYPHELANAGPEHLDPEYVAGYDEKSKTDHTWDVETLKQHGLGSDSLVVDVGGGTGTFAEAIAPHAGRVIVVDVSAPMLAALEARIVDLGIDNAEIVQAGFLSYEHQGDPADFLYSRNALHHLPDFWKVVALRRMADVLKPGGIFLLHDLVYSFEPGDESAIFDSWLANAQPTPEQGYTREELATHIRTEYSTFNWLLEPMLERTGFEILDATHRKTYSAYVCRRT